LLISPPDNPPIVLRKRSSIDEFLVGIITWVNSIDKLKNNEKSAVRNKIDELSLIPVFAIARNNSIPRGINPKKLITMSSLIVAVPNSLMSGTARIFLFRIIDFSGSKRSIPFPDLSKTRSPRPSAKVYNN